MSFSSRQRTYFTKTAKTHETQPFQKCAHIPNTRPILAKKGCRVNATHDPSRSKSPLNICYFKVGGALNRREQPPEPEQITFDK